MRRSGGERAGARMGRWQGSGAAGRGLRPSHCPRDEEYYTGFRWSLHAFSMRSPVSSTGRACRNRKDTLKVWTSSGISSPRRPTSRPCAAPARPVPLAASSTSSGSHLQRWGRTLRNAERPSRLSRRSSCRPLETAHRRLQLKSGGEYGRDLLLVLPPHDQHLEGAGQNARAGVGALAQSIIRDFRGAAPRSRSRGGLHGETSLP